MTSPLLSLMAPSAHLLLGGGNASVSNIQMLQQLLLGGAGTTGTTGASPKPMDSVMMNPLAAALTS
jgi:hypothetical protein